MITPETIKKEASDLWHQYFSDAMRKPQYDEEFCSFLDEQEDAAEAEVRNCLQPWLCILEDSIQWLANIWGILDRLMRPDGNSSLLLSVWTLVGASCTHAVAVRRLVLSGLDTPARGSLRALDEHLCACIAMLNEPELAKEFQASQDPNHFWYKNLNTKSLRKHLNAVERSVGLEPQVSFDMRSWRDSEIGIFSQAIHPSYIACALTVHAPVASNSNVHGPAIFGRASASSERTLNYACKSIWYFSRFGFLILFNDHCGRPPLIKLIKEDEMHQMAVVGRDVISTLNRRYWEYEIYPHESDL